MPRWPHTPRPLRLLALAAIAAQAPTALAHPKPGAHADVRVTVTPSGVRLDLLMNLMFVDGLVQTSRQHADAVTPDEEPRLRAALREYFGSTGGGIGGLGSGDLTAAPTSVIDRPNAVRIDGVLVTPIEREFAIVHPAPEDRPGFEQNPLLLLPQVHLSVEYPCKSAPGRVELVWGTFPLDFLAQDRDTPPPTQIEAILVAQGGVQQLVLTRQEPAYTWHNPGARPLPAPPPTDDGRTAARGVPVYSAALIALTIGCFSAAALRRARIPRTGLLLVLPALAGAWLLVPYGRLPLSGRTPKPTEAEAVAIFRTLHSNVYRAFDYTTEGEIYDALAQSVDGELLDALYTQIYASLIMFEEGGAVSRVKALTPIDDRLDPAPPASRTTSFRVTSRWRVEGIVYHWGHSHTRLNEYLAHYDVAATPQGWRIVGVTPLEQFRVDPAGTPPQPSVPSPDPWHPNR